MAQLLVRDVPDHIAAALKERAAKNGRSAEAEHRVLLEQSLKSDATDFWEDASKIREKLRARGPFTDSAQLIREARDER
jgi:plasmid stability protein